MAEVMESKNTGTFISEHFQNTLKVEERKEPNVGEKKKWGPTQLT